MSVLVEGDKRVAFESGQPDLDKIEWERRERRARRFWVGMILILLFGSMSVWIGTAVVAINDPSMSVLPDYHQQALRWDEVQQERAASDRLGWEVRLGLEPLGSQQAFSGVLSKPPGRPISMAFVTLLDTAGLPVTGASGTLRYYAHARVKRVEQVDLFEQSPGVYRVPLTMDASGLWQWDLKIQRGDQRFVWSQIVRASEQ
jgi:hypothetical protein